MPTNILVINAGSSSLKFHFYEMPLEKIICAGIAERIGNEDASLHYHYGDNAVKELTVNKPITDHGSALEAVMELIRENIGLIAHRVVHGGDEFTEATAIDQEVEASIDALSVLAPLHNPVNLRCIRLMRQHFPAVEQVAVFDTAFHHNMPARAALYAIPDRFFKEEKVRAYGFHGISHKFVTARASEYLGTQNAKLISIHLGNGCSIAAVEAGQSKDTSMGFGPVGGLVMATRSGDIDPAAILHLLREGKMTAADLDTILNKWSGLQALCGMTDLRDIYEAVQSGDQQAAFAVELYAYRIRKYIGAYVAAMNGLDALLFTGGVGEHSSYVRQLVCADLSFFGIFMDDELNNSPGNELREINSRQATIKILVVPTNEELEIARQAFGLVK